SVVIKSEGKRSRGENKVCVQKERFLIKKFASVAALRDLDRCRTRTAGAEQIAVAGLNTGKCSFVSIEPDPKAKFLALGFLGLNVESQEMAIDWDGFDL